MNLTEGQKVKYGNTIAWVLKINGPGISYRIDENHEQVGEPFEENAVRILYYNESAKKLKKMWVDAKDLKEIKSCNIATR